jgi:hypothetical protein
MMSYGRFTIVLVTPTMDGATPICYSTSLMRRWGPVPTGMPTLSTTVEEIPTGEEVLAGMLFLNGHPIIILFDSGASHDFMGSTCAKKAKLSLVASGGPYVISTP